MAEGKQTLVLVPEISLTPQLVQRFEARLGPSLAVSHSGLSDQERLAAWRSAGAGDAAVVIGTRSAVFAPLARPGLMIIDEEHDGSFKQQDGLRYSARDLAVYRARELDLPIVLGSATPSLESLHNVRRGRYQRLELPDRAGGAMPPRIGLIDLKREPAPQGLTPSLRQAMQRHLDAGNQVLLFINRRGYAPAFLCEDCGWVASCDRCDARMTLHRGAAQLRCHHCDRNRRQPERCPECEGALIAVGQGTQRVEETLASAFPDSPVIRIDRDATRRRGRLPELLDQAQSGAARILVGTQMLAKGHHFPEVTLAAILDADQGLYGSDLRAAERLAQLIVQVAGRAGRAERPGEVLIQTAWPEHPLLQRLIEHGYGPFADSALDERAAAGWPPITSLAVLRSEAPDEEMPMRFLTQAAESAPEVPGVTLLGPASATMGRRAGLYRCQLLAVGERASLINFLDTWMTAIDALPLGRKVRWSLDVDPIEVG